MSYDIDLEIDTGGPELATVYEVGNYTSNVSPMWALALGFPLRDLHGRQCGDCIADLKRAVDDILDPVNRATYEAMNPSNGWGDHEGAADYLVRLLSACRCHPKASIRVSS